MNIEHYKKLKAMSNRYEGWIAGLMDIEDRIICEGCYGLIVARRKRITEHWDEVKEEIKEMEEKNIEDKTS